MNFNLSIDMGHVILLITAIGGAIAFFLRRKYESKDLMRRKRIEVYHSFMQAHKSFRPKGLIDFPIERMKTMRPDIPYTKDLRKELFESINSYSGNERQLYSDLFELALFADDESFSIIQNLLSYLEKFIFKFDQFLTLSLTVNTKQEAQELLEKLKVLYTIKDSESGIDYSDLRKQLDKLYLKLRLGVN